MASSTFAAAMSTTAPIQAALDEVIRQIAEQLGGPADLVLAFFSSAHLDAAELISSRLVRELGTECVLAASGESIAGGRREIEEGPALSVWAARLPGTDLLPLHLEFKPAEGGTFVGWPDRLTDAWPADATLLLLGEPFTFPADVLLSRMAEDRPALRVTGGMASAGTSPGENRLILGSRVFRSGAVGVLISGAAKIHLVVSQGCRPIGRPLVVTKSQQNLLLELGGKPALERLRELFGELSEREQQLVQRGLHVGRVINEYQGEFARGDFLVRNVIGFDPDSGAIGIGDFVRVGQTVQFHVRDADTADEDLRELLGGQTSTTPPAAALLFTCNGRGTRLFPQPHHDAAAICQAFGDLPLAGFFAQGEIGPIGGQNFLHGFTASVALFEA